MNDQQMAEKQEIPLQQPNHRRHILIVAGTLLGCLVLVLLRMDRAVGLLNDDACYLLLAKALATGHGYQLINSPTPGIFPLYPPFYSFVLSLVYRLAGEFPDNLVWLKLVSIFSLVGLGWLGYVYLCRERQVPRNLALILAVLSIISPQFVFFVTSTLMSEPLFAFLLVSVFVTIERAVRHHREEGRIRWALFVAGGLLGSAVYLTRGAAIPLLIALPLYLLKERLWRPLLVILLIFVMTIGPWTLYVAQHPVTEAQQYEQAGNIVVPYTTQFWYRQAGDTSSGTITVAQLPARVWANFSSMVAHDTIKILALQLYIWVSTPSTEIVEPFVSVWVNLLSILLFLIVLVGYFANLRTGMTLSEIALPLLLGLILLWPFETIRFLLPLSLFFYFYLFRGMAEIRAWLRRSESGSLYAGRFLRAVLASLLALSLWSHASFLSHYYFGSLFDEIQWVSATEENIQLMRWIQSNIPPTEVLVVSNPALVHLWTGHKTVGVDSTPGRLERLRRELGVRYIVLHAYYGNAPLPEMQGFAVVHRINNLPDFQVLDMGPVAQRP
ncbi:MAG: hypothetical protein ACO394_05415 [Blastocatellia bacterium]